MINFDIAILLIVILIIVIILIWYMMYTTRPPSSVGPRWKAVLVKSEIGQSVEGKVWMDPERERINYLINIHRVRSIPRTAEFKLQSSHAQLHPPKNSKHANFFLHGHLLTLAGHWDMNDLYTPLDEVFIQSWFDEGVELSISTDNKPKGEMMIHFKLIEETNN